MTDNQPIHPLVQSENSPDVKSESAAGVDADIQDGTKKVKLHFNMPVVVACVIALIAAIVIGLVVLEQFGVMDDFVKMKTHRSDKR